MKAHLKGSHYVAAIIAGIVGNIFFSTGWSLLGVTLFFGLFAAIFGGSIESIIGQFTDPAAISGFFSSAGGIAAGLTVGFSIAALVLVGLGVLFSGLILKGGKVRKPWATTWLSVLISALLREVIAPSGEFGFEPSRTVPLKGFKGEHSLTPLRWRD